MDSLIRIIAIIQTSWNIIQVIVRGIRHLAISQLEITVIAFAACAVLMYSLNWFKPKGVQTPIVFMAYQDEAPLEIAEVLSFRNRRNPMTMPEKVSRGLFKRRKSSAGSHISNLGSQSGDEDNGEILALLCGLMIFGGIHIAAWKFDFPSHAEQILWKASSLWCTLGSIVLILLILLLEFEFISDKVTERLLSVMAKTFTAIYIVLYILARLYLLVEIFRTLCFLPPSAYYSTWAANILHVS